MTERRQFIHATALVLAPVIVAWFGLSVVSATLLVILLLLWRWAVSISGLVMPESGPELVLETISASHFVEKVRWCMDRLGIEYTEKADAGTLGAFYRGRTVPRLRMRTGSARSSIGNSSEILRYLWGRYQHQDKAAAAFLEPTTERLDLERRLDRYGVALQIWIYYRILEHRDLTLRAWGVYNTATPLWQRQLLRLLYPLQKQMIRRSFRINDSSFERSVKKIEEILKEANDALSDGREAIIAGDSRNYTDYQFAAMTGLWLQPPGFANGMAAATRVEREQLPEPMRIDIESWERANPRAVAFVNTLYEAERAPLAR